MIYLIDDKRTRQKDFGWTKEKFAQYASCLTPLYNINDVVNIGEDLYNDGNIILYHESFLDFTGDRDRAVEQRNKLAGKAASINGLSVAFFSGSQSSRSLDKDMAFLPVATLYQNLEVLIQQYNQQCGHLKHILFGENPEIEEKLNELLTKANREIERDAAVISGSNLFIRPNSRYIQNAIEGASEEIFFNDVSDEKLSEKINDWLGEREYDNIYIPLCFGKTLSDFNGLRLATHIRCTPTSNQIKRIFIYSFVGIEYLYQNEYFNILKTQNVQLVDYSKKAFELVANDPFITLKQEGLEKQINMLKLDPPLNYVDSHSIANEWAVYRWAHAINASDNSIQSVNQNIGSNLYFKYLTTIYPPSQIAQVADQELKINCDSSPYILYVDDDAEKGWFEIFSKILVDINDFDLQYIDSELDGKSQNEIISLVSDKVVTEGIDLVMLDYRLYPGDFDQSDFHEITGLKLLNAIKSINPGIQVIMFSATNKIWNLQAMQDAGANGFVIKEAPENNGDSGFKSKSVAGFLNLFFDATKRIFIKDFYKSLFRVEENLNSCDFEDGSGYEGFLKELKSQLKIVRQTGKQVDPKVSMTIDVAFLMCYNFLERFKDYYLLEKDYRFYLGSKELSLHRYQYRNGFVINEGEFIRDGQNDNPSWFQCITGLLVDYFEVIGNEDPTIKILWQVKNCRNSYIHERKSFFSKAELLEISNLMIKITSAMKE